MGDVTVRMRRNVRSVINFGPAILQGLMQQPDSRGYSQIKTRFGPFHVRLGETDLRVLTQIFVHGEYNLERFPQGALIRLACQEMLDRGKCPVIIDAGANAGYAARFFAGLYPKAHILSVEPDPGNAALCRTNTIGLPQIEVIEAAIGSRPGYVSMKGRPGHAWSVRTYRAEAGVPVVTIGDLLARVPNGELFIVKIDIEGFEHDLFAEGATDWIANARVIIAEPHDWMLPGAGTSQTLQRAMLAGDRELLVLGENLVWIKR